MTNEDDRLAWLKPVSLIASVVGLLAGYKSALAELAGLFHTPNGSCQWQCGV